MFLNRFPRHSWAILRAESLQLRYKDCSIWTTLLHSRRFTGEGLGVVIAWTMTEELENDIRRILADGEEKGNVFSYLPYASDFILNQKTLFSASMNKSMHTMLHVCCVLLGATCSITVRVPSGEEEMEALSLGMLMAYAYRNLMCVGPRFVLTADDATAAHD